MMAGKSALHSLCRPIGIVALQNLLRADSQNCSARRRLNRERVLEFLRADGAGQCGASGGVDGARPLRLSISPVVRLVTGRPQSHFGSQRFDLPWDVATSVQPRSALWLAVRNKNLAQINKSCRRTISRAANGKTRYI